jgi:iron complex outermembrane receptor protein
MLLAASSLAILAAPLRAEGGPPASDIVVTAQRRQQGLENPPSTAATIDAATAAATINAVDVEDEVKYLPSLLVRKRHIGDTQAPLATRTSGLGSSARSLIYVDGILLSSLIGNNNISASPRWGLVSPQEVARIDLLYGPFAAAYPGNSIGAVVNITTRLPDALEATLSAGTTIQRFDQYDTHQVLPSYRMGATLGDRFGSFAFFASADRVASNGQPLAYVTALRPAAPGGAGAPTIGGFDALNRTGVAIRLLGANGFEHQIEERWKLKAVLDLAPGLRLSYLGGLFLNRTDARAQSYLQDAATGQPVFAGSFNIDGQTYVVPASAFSGGVYSLDERHWAHSLSLDGSGRRVDWQLVATLYDFGRDVQRIPTIALPGAQAGGAGTITRLDGTGWKTLDAKGAWRSDAAGTHVVGFGAHGDWFRLASNRFRTGDWINGAAGQLDLQSAGRTRTAALWAQDAWKPPGALTLIVGGRYEWWKAEDGVNFSLAPALAAVQPPRAVARFSPKASLAWEPDRRWTARLSFGQAWRFPTVSELYQIVTAPVAAVPDPNLRPERARSEELSLERHDERGFARLSLFNEAVKDALISQTGPLNGSATLATFVQNVDRTRARGVELAFRRTGLIAGFDVSGSVTYADAETRDDMAFPAAIGKLLPSVPRWRATLVATWRASDTLSLTAAARYSSRNFATIDNSDVVGNTFQGFYQYLVVDLRAELKVARHWSLGLGVDNAGNDKYFLFHPFPQRSWTADLSWRF